MPADFHEKFMVERMIGLVCPLFRISKFETEPFKWLEAEGSYKQEAAMDIGLPGFSLVRCISGICTGEMN